MNVFDKGSTRPPFVFNEEDQPVSTTTTLPPSKLATMAGFDSTPSPFSLFKPVLDQLKNQDFKLVNPDTSTTTTPKPFSMPSYFGGLLDQEEDHEEPEPVNPTKVYHTYHNYEPESPSNVKDW